MPVLADLTDALIALIPEDGSRISNDQIRAALEQEAGEPISDETLKEIKALVVAMGAAEGVKGPGGGLKAPGVEAPVRAAPAASGGRPRRSGNGTTPATPSSTIAPGTTAASELTGELRNQSDRIRDAFWSGGISDAASEPSSRCAAASSRMAWMSRVAPGVSSAGAASRN